MYTVNHAQFLGVMIDGKISWSDHINYTCYDISKSIDIIKKAKNRLNNNILANLYNTFIYPYITYSILVWEEPSK